MTRTGGLDVAANRGARKYRARVQVARVLWWAAWPFFALSPRPLWGWRRMLLRIFGAHIGAQVHVYPSARITMPWNLKIGAQAAVGDNAILYALGQITIGPRATVSQYAHLCAGNHDIDRLDRALLTPPIEIGAEAWIAAEAFVGPGVTVGPRAVVGARAVAMKDIAPRHVVAGNPAKAIRRLDP